MIELQDIAHRHTQKNGKSCIRNRVDYSIASSHAYTLPTATILAGKAVVTLRPARLAPYIHQARWLACKPRTTVVITAEPYRRHPPPHY